MSAPPPAPPLKGRGGIRFAGYAAVFGRPDTGGDVVRSGAFERSLKMREAVPLLCQHKGQAIGRIEHLSEDSRGLRVIASVADERTAGLLRSGRLSGLSFGYRVREARHDGARRELVELDLIEVSLVARPMQPKARVHAVEDA
ncbi:MAG TPA: HK97 family phage prohead protease [Sphingomicrobium sp.]|nr:HK97 family phage prohead protease [Sphingomicrobium sp.]